MNWHDDRMLPVGPMWPPEVVEAARVRALKKRIERRLMASLRLKMKRRLPK